LAQIKVITKNAPDAFYDEKYKDRYAVEDVIRYIFNPQKAKGYVGGWAVDPNCAAYEMELLAYLHHKDSGIRLRHWVITFADFELNQICSKYKRNIPEALYQLGFEFSAFYAPRYQIVFAAHLDTSSPHLHFVMNSVSYVDGTKFPGTKADLYDYEKYAKQVGRSYDFHIYTVTDHSATNPSSF